MVGKVMELVIPKKAKASILSMMMFISVWHLVHYGMNI